MTWKERRTVTLLLSIAAVLAAALLIVFALRYREHRAAVTASSSDALPTEPGAITDPAACTSLTYYNGSATLTFSLQEDGTWVWADGPDFPLDGAHVTAMVDALAALKFQQVLPASESLESYGLDSPSATITAASANGTVQNLLFGKTTTDGDSYYMMMNGEESTVYIVADDLVRMAQTPIYAMCRLPETPDLSVLRSVTVQGPLAEAGEETETGKETETPQPPAVTLTARQAGEGDPLWFSGNDNVTANPLVQELLRDLRGLAVTQCVDYFPSDAAASICGFDQPAAQLEAVYAANGADQTFALTVGASMPGGSGYYVRLEGSAIYALAPDALDALLTIAGSGLRGS